MLIPNSETAIPTVELLGVPVHALRLSDLLDHANRTIERGEQSVYQYANIHILNLACEVPGLRRVMQKSLVYCDGYGVKLAAVLRGGSLPERFTLPDWIDDLCRMCLTRGYSLYLLGGREGIAAKAAGELQRRHAGLQIAGTRHGFFDPSPDAPENQDVLRQISSVRPSILLVCLGSPQQEFWIDANRAAMPVPVLISGGAVLDYVSGRMQRAPRWLTDHGFEWLGRLILEPRRLWRRYLLGIPKFIVRLIVSRGSASQRADHNHVA